MDHWLSRRHRYIVAAIIILSLAARVAYFIQLSAGPLVHQHEWNQCDMNYFDAWAKQIVAGDWLSRHVAPPMHSWLVRTADACYGEKPADTTGGPATRPEDEARRRDRAHALWQKWCGNGKLWQEPLYPYLVAATYRLFGPEVRWVFIWQMLLGTASNVLVYLIAKKCFGNLAGLLAGLFAVLYAPLLMYEMVLLRETTIVFASLAFAYLAMTVLDRSSPWRWFVTGLAFGISLMLKVQFCLMLLGFAGIAIFSMRRQPRAAIRRIGLLVLGAAVGFAPLVVRNLVVGVSSFQTASGGAPTFALSDAVEADTYTWDEQHLVHIMRESQGGLIATIAATLHTHPGLASVLRLVGKRFMALWQWYECPNNENFYYYRLYAGVLRWLPLTFGYLAPVAGVGLLVSLRRRENARSVLYVVILVNIALLLVFPVWCRFRLPLAAALLPFSGFILARLIEWLVARRWVISVGTVGAIAALGAWTNRPTDDSVVLIRCADCTVPHKVYYNPKIEAAYKTSDWQTIASILIESLRYEPDEVRQLGPAKRVRLSEEACLAELYIRKRQLLVHALGILGRRQEVEHQNRRMQELLESLRPSDASQGG